MALFVGFGVATFYPGPKQPTFPTVLNTYNGKEQTAEQIRVQNEFNAATDAYQRDFKPYSRNVSMIVLGAAVIFLAISLLLEHKLVVVADGILFGGLFTLLYSIIRSVMSEDSRYVFIVITVALAVVIYLGYHKFIRRRVLKPQP